MRAKYESKYKNFYSNKQLDGVITDVSNEMKVSKLKVAEYVEHFLKWQHDAFDEMISPSYSWKGFGHITTHPDCVVRWDEMKKKAVEKRANLLTDANKINKSNETKTTN
jgi:hypothetical protein